MFSVRRRGFTLIELLMVVLIIGLLVALLLPAINSMRESGRRAVCLQKMRQLALAVEQYELTQKHYPGWRHFFTNTSGSQTTVSWTVLALPYLERGDLFRSIKQTGPTADNLVSLNALLVCPSDQDKLAAGEPALSYVGNTGRIDRPDLAEGNAVPPDWRSNGVFMHVYDREEPPVVLM